MTGKTPARLFYPALLVLLLLNLGLWTIVFWDFDGPAGLWQQHRDLRDLNDPAAVEPLLAPARRPFADQNSFDREVALSGLTRAQIAHLYREHARDLDQLHNAPSPELSEEQLRRFYKDHPQAWQLPELLEARHIFLIAAESVTPDWEVRQQEEKIRAIAARLSAGEEFAALAAELSEDPATKDQGGLLPLFTPQQVPPVFREQIAALQPGELSEPFYEPALGWHIVRLESRTSPRQATFEEVRPLLETELR